VASWLLYAAQTAMKTSASPSLWTCRTDSAPPLDCANADELVAEFERSPRGAVSRGAGGD